MAPPHALPAFLCLLGACVAAPSQKVQPQPAQSDPLHRHLAADLESSDGGPWLTPVISDGSPFTEVLPSWNVAKSHAFHVDVRVAATEDGRWSPWLRIGDWNVTERDPRVVTEFPGGKVAVDVLQLDEPHRRAQLRFASASGASLSPEDIRVRIVLSDLRKIDAAMAKTRSAEWPEPIELDVSPRSQRVVGDDIAHRVCSPTSVAMVVAYHGSHFPTREVAERIFDPHFDLYGNWNRAVQGAYSFDVPGELVRVSTWDHARRYLAANRPIIASIRAKEGQLAGAPYEKTAGHLLVVTGLGPDGAVRVNDPAAAGPGSVPRTYSRADMETVWFANGGVSYVLGSGMDETKSEGEAR